MPSHAYNNEDIYLEMSLQNDQNFLVKKNKEYKFRLGQNIDVKIVDLDISKGLMDFEIYESDS